MPTARWPRCARGSKPGAKRPASRRWSWHTHEIADPLGTDAVLRRGAAVLYGGADRRADDEEPGGAERADHALDRAARPGLGLQAAVEPAARAGAQPQGPGHRLPVPGRLRARARGAGAAAAGLVR